MAIAYVEIPLGGKKAAGRVALIDIEDYDLVSGYHWMAWMVERPGRRPNGPYAYATISRDGRRTTLLMHVLLTGFSRTDHRDGDGLNNRRSNLRDGSGSKNQYNKQRSINGSSNFKGVCWDASSHRWRSRIWINKAPVNLGSFEDEVIAARAYDQAASEAYGAYALLNFPEG